MLRYLYFPEVIKLDILFHASDFCLHKFNTSLTLCQIGLDIVKSKFLFVCLR